MRIGLVGDTHGNLPWMTYCVNKMKREGISTVIQLGDFGVWPGGHAAMNADIFSGRVRAAGQEWFVVPGNHEDYDQINALLAADGDNDFVEFRPGVYLCRRGSRWEWGGMSFVALGGAPSVDRTIRQKNHWGWWAAEAIEQADVDVVAVEGYADVMLCHDSPLGSKTIAKNISGNPFGFDPIDLEYAAEGRVLLTEAVRAVKPKFLVHGHYHFKVNENVTIDDFTFRQVGLGKDDANFSMGVLDTETRKIEIWDIGQDYNEYRWDQ